MTLGSEAMRAAARRLRPVKIVFDPGELQRPPRRDGLGAAQQLLVENHQP